MCQRQVACCKAQVEGDPAHGSMRASFIPSALQCAVEYATFFRSFQLKKCIAKGAKMHQYLKDKKREKNMTVNQRGFKSE
jgi:hypothetical protein